MKFIKYIDIVDGEPVLLEHPVKIDYKPNINLPSFPHATIIDDYSDYLTDEENKKVYWTTDGITINTDKYLYSFHQRSMSGKECADLIKEILSKND